MIKKLSINIHLRVFKERIKLQKAIHCFSNKTYYVIFLLFREKFINDSLALLFQALSWKNQRCEKHLKEDFLVLLWIFKTEPSSNSAWWLLFQTPLTFEVVPNNEEELLGKLKYLWLKYTHVFWILLSYNPVLIKC